MVTKTVSSFEGEDMQAKYNVLNYRTYIFININRQYKLMKNGHSERNNDYEIKKQKAIAKELGYEFSRIDPDKENFDIFRGINEIFRHIKQSTKKI